MNIEALLRAPVAAPVWQGSWARLFIRPDVFSAQEFVVGAIALDDRGVADFRVISGGQKFECVYGTGTRQMFDRTLSELRLLLSDARAKHEPLPTDSLPEVFRIEPAGMLREQMPGEALDRMLRDGTIPLEEEEPKGKRERFASRAADEVVKDVLDRVRLRAGIGAESFIREDFFGDQRHQVGVNLVTPRAAGVVASGWFATADRIQLEFLLGATKLDTYVTATGRDRSRSALFFLRPTNDHGLPRAVWSDVETRLGELEWQLEQQKIRVVTAADPALMADQVVEWADAVR